MFDLTSIDWESTLPRFGIDRQFLSKKHGPCPTCGGTDRFRFDNKGGKGTFFCSFCGAGNGLTLISKYTGCTIAEAIKKLNGAQLITPHKRQAFAKKEAAANDVNKLRKALQNLWVGSKSIANGDPVARYINYRVPGFKLEWLSSEVRFHPGIEYYEEGVGKKGKWPGMLARAKSSSGEPITLHRTYLTSDGFKAPFANVKKQMKGKRMLSGDAIRLNNTQSTKLAVCEGIETGLAIMAASNNKIAVWVFLNAGNLAKADIPNGMFDEVIIYADRDPVDVKTGWRPGEHYAQQLLKKLKSNDQKARIKVPDEEGVDFCDIWSRITRTKDLSKM